MMFRIINYNEIIDKDNIISKSEYIGESNIDFSKIYHIDFYIDGDKLLEKLFSRDFEYLNIMNRKNKLNKISKKGKIDIKKQFIDFYLNNKNNIYLIKLQKEKNE